jgi:uncharacterized protein YjdB
MSPARCAALAATLLLTGLFVACGQGRHGVPRPIAFAIRPATVSAPLGADVTLRVIATYQGGEQVDLTDGCEWTASPANVLLVGDAGDRRGVVTGLALGAATVTARDPASRSVATASLMVTPAAVMSVEVTPTNPRIAVGTTRQFTATGTLTDGSTQDLTNVVTWSSSATGVATVDAAGLASSATVGTTTVTALHAATGEFGDTLLTVTPAVLVSLQVTPTNPSIALGTTRQFTATGTFSDNTVQDLTTLVTWSSSATGVATVGSSGFAASVATGSVTITATHAGSGLFGDTVLTVTPAVLTSLAVTPPSPSLALGTTQPFAATGTYSDNSTQDLTTAVTWSSSVAGVATISNAASSEGLATSVATGTTTITAAHAGSGLSGNTVLTVTPAVLTSIAVTPTSPSIALGTTRQFTATGTYSDSSTQDLTTAVTWSSSSTGVATISNAGGSRGLATSVATGTTTITAVHAGTSLSDNTVLTVTPAVLTSIAVTPTSPQVALGTTRQFTATGTYSDSSTQDLTTAVTWSSSATGVATISNAASSDGLATSVATGTTTITAVHAGSSLSDNTVLTVTPAVLMSIAVTPASPQVALGTTRQFTATGTYSDSSTQDLTTTVTWSSSATGTATISNAGGSKGLATSVAMGTTTITAVHAGSGLSDNTVLTVTAAVLTSIAVTPASPTIALGTTRQFTATGTYSDSSTQDLTTAVTWSSSATGAATISNAGGSKGLATSVAAGTTTITAVHAGSGLSDNTVLTVTPATLTSIAVTPSSPSISIGATQQFTATGTYSDSSTQDLTTAVTWSSSATGVATISNAGGSQGLATGVAGGTATITALHAGSGTSGNTVLTVRPDIQLRAVSSAGAASGVLGLTVATPTGSVTDDVLLAAIAVRPNTAVVTPPTGWTLVRRIDNAAGAANSLLVYHRTVTAGEPANHTWTFSASTGSAGGLAAFVNVDTGNIVDVEAGQTTASAVVHTAPSIVTTVASTMLVTLHAFSSSASWTSPPAMSEAFDVASEALGATGISLSGHYVLRPTAGATGTRSATASNDADVGNAASIALRRTP